MDTNNYGAKFILLAHDAIQRKERELKSLESVNKSDVRSVGQFEECWLEYLIFDHVIRQHISLGSQHSCGDKERIDLCLRDDNGQTIALFELKLGKPSNRLTESIKGDCEKLRHLTNVSTDIQRYVLAVVRGLPSQIEGWQKKLTGRMQATHVALTRPLPDIPSNIEGEVLRLILLQVKVESALVALAPAV